MKESKILERVRVAVIKIVTMLFISYSAVSFSAECEVTMIITNSENTLTYSNLSLNVSSELTVLFHIYTMDVISKTD